MNVLVEKQERLRSLTWLRSLDRAGRLTAIVVPYPSGAWIEPREPAEVPLIRRIIARMKAESLFLTGVADLLFLWHDGAGAIELKRPPIRTLFGTQPAGRLSPAQLNFREDCRKKGVPLHVCGSFAEVRDVVCGWGIVLSPGDPRVPFDHKLAA